MSKIFLRRDQKLSYIKNQNYQDSSVTIFAPNWVQKGLDILSNYVPIGTNFKIYDNSGDFINFQIDRKLDLKLLEMIARNEPLNTTGEINFSNYSLSLNKSVIYAFKDLVRQCIIVAKDQTTHYGGYPKSRKLIKQTCQLYIVDLIALQFQNKWNTGRLVLISNKLPIGILDDLIYENVVGEKKKSFSDVINDKSGRYIKYNDTYFDVIAYEKFVANDVLLSGFALNIISNQKINFKFLKYGTGYFSGNYQKIIEKQIGNGVALGLYQLFKTKQKRIKSVELPYFAFNENIVDICKTFKIDCKFGSDDALKQTHSEYITATTNCSNAHTITGNSLGTSVDGTIAKNLVGNANKFSSIINRAINENMIEYFT